VILGLKPLGRNIEMVRSIKRERETRLAKQMKIAIITGSGRGIGRGTAIELARVGWQIIINDIGHPESPRETLELVRKAGSDGLIVMADITSAPDRIRLLDETLEHYGQIDLLVNNAGVGPKTRMDILETTEESLRFVLDVNTIGPFLLTQVVSNTMRRMVLEGRITNPKIINIGSISSYTSSANRAGYCISKAAVSMMTILFADRLAEFGILVYEIRPGIIRTPMTEIVKEKYDNLISEGMTPIKRWGLPEDIGKAIVAIAEGYLPFSTGQVIDVDGGFHIRRL